MIGNVLGGRYRIDALVGKGGMAIVYRATDLRTHRTVAVKVLREEYLQNEEFLQRFDREAMVCAKTSHPNIVNLLDIGEEADRTRYLVMEYVKGRTLKELIVAQGRIEPAQAVNMTLQILCALGHAHQRHIIHRDIKPQNMLVSENNHVKVADFGIARMTDAKTMTIADGNVMGSVHYFSPEQAKGEPVSQAGDLYSVGVMLYEMLCGHVPFDGDTPVTVAMKHLNEIPKSLLNVPGVSVALDQIVQKALCKQVNQRYQSAEEMARDLRKALRHPEGGFVNMRPALADEKTSGNRSASYEEAYAPRRRTKRVAPVVISVFFSLAVVTALIWACMTIYQRAMQRVRMPDFMGLDEATAMKVAESAGLSSVVTRRTDQSVQGLVIEQRPATGTEMRRGDAAYITVSEGPNTLIVPNVTGVTPEEAVILLAEAGLSVGDEIHDISQAMAGTVYMQNPSTGTVVKPGSVVDLYVSRGLVILSDLTGRHLEEAELELERLGLVHGNIRSVEVDSISKDGVVLTQEPLPFEHTYPGAEVEMTVGYYDKRKYSAQITLGLTLPDTGANVRISLVEPDGREAEQFNWTYEKGGHVELNVALRSESAGKLAYRVYIDNAFYSETPVTLQPVGEGERASKEGL